MMITKIFDREKKITKKKSAKRPTGGTVTVKDFSLCALNLFNTRVSQFELNY